MSPRNSTDVGAGYGPENGMVSGTRSPGLFHTDLLGLGVFDIYCLQTTNSTIQNPIKQYIVIY